MSTDERPMTSIPALTVLVNIKIPLFGNVHDLAAYIGGETEGLFFERRVVKQAMLELLPGSGHDCGVSEQDPEWF